jgi:hypothetical protein
LLQNDIVISGMSDFIRIQSDKSWSTSGRPESLLGDLRAQLGLAEVTGPAYQIIRNGARWDITFEGESFSISDKASAGMQAIAMLLQRPNQPIPAIDIQAAIHHVDRRTLSGSSGPKNDRQTRAQVHTRLQELADRMHRNGEEHPEYDAWETELDQLLAYRQENESIGGKNAEITTAAKAGRAVGGAIKRAISEISRNTSYASKLMSEHLSENIVRIHGQRPCYKPNNKMPGWDIFQTNSSAQE